MGMPIGKLGCQRVLSCISLAALGLLAACGGGGSSDSRRSPTEGSSRVSGSVAVGAPMSDAVLRIVDANGNVIASGVNVDAAGAYANVALTGTGPWRIEACGHAGENYRCVYSVAQAAGTANVTPLTTAAILLATGESPEDLMHGTSPTLTPANLASAQTALRQGLSAVLADAGVASDFDFISGSLAAGTRTGYDRVLDSVGVTTGEATQPFVQITPRLGTGNLYIEAGSSAQGSLTVDSGASGVSLSGIETLFNGMTQALVSSSACNANLEGLLASTASMSFGGATSATGAHDVATLMCAFIGDTANEGPGFGVSFVSPTLGRCDLSGADPVCRVSFVLRLSDGSLESIGEEMSVVREGGVWKFKGEVNPISLRANATVQRAQAYDANGVLAHTEYMRAFQFDIQAYAGVQCAKVAQRNAAGNEVVLAYFKRYSGSPDRLSAWRDNWGNVELNPTASGGTLRGADDTWIMLPSGSSGDAMITNFYRAGRSVTVSLFSNSNCTSAFSIAGNSEFDVDMMGVPPLSDRLESFPWPNLSAGSVANLRALNLAANATGSLQAAWTFSRGYTGLGEASVCTDYSCGGGSPERIGEQRVNAANQTVNVALTNGSTILPAAHFKMLSLYGRTGEGMGVQANFVYCPNGVGTDGQCLP